MRLSTVQITQHHKKMKRKEMAGKSCRLISGTTQAFVYRHYGNPEIFHLVHHDLDQKLAPRAS